MLSKKQLLISLTVGILFVLPDVAVRAFQAKSHRIGIMVEDCWQRCKPQPDLTIVNNSGRDYVLLVGHNKRIIILSHTYTEVHL